MTPVPAAPLNLWTGFARTELMDYNGHLMDGCYLVALTEATEALLAHVGFGPAYRETAAAKI